MVIAHGFRIVKALDTPLIKMRNFLTNAPTLSVSPEHDLDSGQMPKLITGQERQRSSKEGCEGSLAILLSNHTIGSRCCFVTILLSNDLSVS